MEFYRRPPRLPEPPAPDGHPIEIWESPTHRQATARLRQGVVKITLPQRWSRARKHEVAIELAQRVEAQARKQARLVEAGLAQGSLISLPTVETLTAYVNQLNAQTFQVPLAKVRIGHAKYSRLAQMNLRTRVMTVSSHCLSNVPEPALRYLIVHELAHLLEAGHTQRFWRLVAAHVPDYRLQSKIINAFHSRAIDPANDGQKPQIALQHRLF